MNNSLKTMNKEFNLQREQMKNTSTASEKLEAEVEKLNKEYELSQQKARVVASALDNVKEITGENSNATRIWNDKLLDAQKNQEYLKNKLAATVEKMNAAKEAEKELTEEEKKAIQSSEKRKEKLEELDKTQDKLKSSSEKLTTEYDLQVASLGKNASESEKLKLKQKYLADQITNTASQVANLEEQLENAKKEYGETSNEVDELEQELLDARLANQQFSNDLQQSSDRLQNFSDRAQVVGDKLKNVGTNMSMYVTAPIVAGVALSVKAASEFDSAFTGVKKTVNELVDVNGEVLISYEDLEKGIRDMAQRIPASTTEISAVAEAAGQLGIKTDAILGFTETMIAMGESTNISSEEAASSLAQLANITQMPQDKFDELGSTIVALGNSMATTEADIVAMSLRLAGSANQANMTEDEVLALAAAMSSVGINAEAGGGSMSRIMQAINSDVMSGQGALEQYAKVSGMTASEFQRAWKEDAASALTIFVKGLGEAKDAGADVTSILNDMGIKSTLEVDTMLRLSGAGELLGQALQTSAAGWEENTALTSEAEKRYETFSSQLQIVKNKVVDLGIEFGGPFMTAISSALDALDPMFSVLGNLATKFSEASPFVQQLVMGFVAFVAIAGPLLLILGGVVTSIGALIPVLAAILSPVTLVVVAIAGFVAALVTAYTKSEEFRNKVNEVFNAVKSIIEVVMEAVSSYIKEKLEQIQQFWEENGSQILEACTNVFNAIKAVIEFIMPFIKSLIEDTWNAIKNVFDGALNVILGLVKIFSSLFTGDWKGVWEGVKQVFSGAIEAIWGLLQLGFLGKIFKVVKTFGSKALGVVGDLAGGMKSKFDDIVSAGASKFEALKEKVLSPLRWVRDKAKGILEEIKGFFDKLKLKIPKPSLPKLPHFKLKTGSKTVFDKTITYPTGFDVDWYAKGGIMTKPTAFGMNGSKVMVGGEAGQEAILPLNSNTLGMIGAGIVNSMNLDNFWNGLKDYVSNVSGQNNVSITMHNSVRSDDDINKITKAVNEQLAFLNKRQQMAKGR